MALLAAAALPAFRRARKQRSQSVDEEDDNAAEAVLLLRERLCKQLSALPVFADVCRDAIELLCGSVRRYPVEHGTTLSLDGEHTDSLLIVEEGEVNVFVRGKLVRCVTDGQYIGVTRFLGIKRSGGISLVSNSDSMLCELPRDCFLRAISRFPAERDKFEEIRAFHQGCMSVGIMIQTCKLLCGLSIKALISIDSSTFDRFYFPGEYIFQEGAARSELYLLVSGRVAVEESCHIKHSLSGSDSQVRCFGELPFLGIKDTHTISVRAMSICLVRILHRSALTQVLMEHQEALHLEQMLLALEQDLGGQGQLAEFGKSPERGLLYELEIGRPFLDFVTTSCEQRVYLHEQVIIDAEKVVDKCMFLIVSGVARAVQDGDESKAQMLFPGGIVGESMALGFTSQHTTSVTSVGLCCAWKISEDVLIDGLKKFPEEREKVLLLAFSNQPIEKLPQDDTSKDFIMRRRESLRRKTMQSIAHKAMQNSPIFEAIGREFVEDMADIAHFQIYLPGDRVVEQGDKGDSMFIFISGEATVHVQRDSRGPSEQVGRLCGGSLCGEMTLLGVSLARTATVVAATICTAWEITQHAALQLLDKFPEQKHNFESVVVSNLEYTVLSCIQQAPLFRPFDSKFKTLIYLYCERRAYWSGARIAEQGEVGKGLYVINRGMATLDASGCTVTMCSDGYCFGASVMLGLQKVLPCSLIALQTCHVVIVTRESYLLARDRYPSGVYATNKGLEVEERNAMKKLSRMIAAACRGKTMAVPKAALESLQIADLEVLQAFLLSWHEYVVEKRQTRRRSLEIDRINKEAIGRWIDKLNAAREHRKHEETRSNQDNKDQEPKSHFSQEPKNPPRSYKRTRIPRHNLNPYGADLVDLMWDLPNPGSPSHGNRLPLLDARSTAAIAKHVKRVIDGKTKQSEKMSLELPPIPRSRILDKIESECETIKFPPLVAHVNFRKGLVNSSLLQPVLLRDLTAAERREAL